MLFPVLARSDVMSGQDAPPTNYVRKKSTPAGRYVYHASVVLFTSKYLACYVCSLKVSKFLAPAGRYVYSNAVSYRSKPQRGDMCIMLRLHHRHQKHISDLQKYQFTFSAPAERYVYRSGYAQPPRSSGAQCVSCSICIICIKNIFRICKNINSRFPLQRSGMSIEADTPNPRAPAERNVCHVPSVSSASKTYFGLYGTLKRFSNSRYSSLNVLFA